jgi:hypothetical protein
MHLVRPFISRKVFNDLASQYSDEDKQEYDEDARRFLGAVKTIRDINQGYRELLHNGFKWVSDPYNGLLDFSPEELWLFFARKGDDCDGWADLSFEACKHIGLKPKVWVVIDGLHLSSAHVVTTCFDPGTTGPQYALFNNYDVTYFESEDEALEEFRRDRLVAYGKYEDLVKVLWKQA